MTDDDGERWEEGIVIFGVKLRDLPVCVVPSLPYPCDMCGERIWLSQQTISKVSEVMETGHPNAQILYLCQDHDDELVNVDHQEYGCPACPGDVCFPTREEVIAHYRAEHMP